MDCQSALVHDPACPPRTVTWTAHPAQVPMPDSRLGLPYLTVASLRRMLSSKDVSYSRMGPARFPVGCDSDADLPDTTLYVPRTQPVERAAAPPSTEFSARRIGFHPSSRDDVESEYLFTERLVLAVSSKHPLAEKRRVQWKTLDSIPLGLLTQKFSTRILIEEAFRIAGAQLRVVVEMETTESLLAVAAEGGLATIVPERAGTGFACVNQIRITPTEMSRESGLLWPKGSDRTRAATTFADALRNASVNLRYRQKT